MAIKFQISDKALEIKKTSSSRGFQQKSGASGPMHRYSLSTSSTTPTTKSAQMTSDGGMANVMSGQPAFFSPLHTPQNWQIASKRREILQWARFFYENEPKVAAGIDFYSLFPMNGFRLECKDKKTLKFYEKLVKKIKLDQWLRFISFEYYLFGDVFPFVEYDCPICHGVGVLPNGQQCGHPGGTVKRIVVLNPDWITVQSSPMSSEPVYMLEPDDELKAIVSQKKPFELYSRLPKSFVNSILTGQPIVLSNRTISHIKHQGSPYGTYGTSVIRRLFTCLAYKAKLMTANWIIAERLILPIRIVKVGDKERPASQADLADVATQLTYVANDPNLTLVTHHAFELTWEGASGRIHNITQEMELIGKEILDGLMLNQAILNGEMGSYSSVQIGIEVTLRRLENWRNTLAEWVENNIFLPVAMMQGFVDEEESKQSGEKEYMKVKFVFNDLQIRDKTNERQAYMQLFDHQIISVQTLLEKFDLDYDKEIHRKREEQVLASSTGMILGPAPAAGGMGGGMGGGMDLGGMLGGMEGGGGGAPPMDMGGGMGAAPGMPGGDMGMGGMAGGAPGGAAPAGGGAAMAAQQVSPTPVFVGKRGAKRPEQEQPVQAPPKQIQLTKLEQKMLKILTGMSNKIPYKIYGQYELKLPGQPQAFLADFAYPAIGVIVEADGEQWHEEIESKTRDTQRDQKLANVGWRVLRFKEEAINNQADDVARVIYSNVVEAAREKSQRIKKASNDGEIKIAELAEYFVNIKEENITYDRKDIINDGVELGVIYYIGAK